MTSEIEAAVAPVAIELERLHIPYYLAGSVVSSLYGIARATADVDLVAALHRDHAAPLARALADLYYADEDMLREAADRAAMCNVIHLGTMLKVDVYVAHTAFDRSALARRRRDTLSAAPDAPSLDVASPEDVVLHKLRWFRDGGELSERQWGDILGVLRVQRTLDLAFLRLWAQTLDVEVVLARALAEAGYPHE